MPSIQSIARRVVARIAVVAVGALSLEALALASFALACSPRSDDARRPAADTGSGFRGVVVSPPFPKPDFTLTDFDGRPFDFRKGTEGKVTLLFFGYTHCPDVCPLHVANIASVLKRLPFEERAAIRFVFVTTDPERDTPARLKEWLGNFDPSFVGLTGPVEEVNRILYGLRMAPAQRDPEAKDSATYLVGHAAQVLAFGTDGMARTEYPFGIRQDDWAHDLPKLARGEMPVVTADAPVASPAEASPQSAAPIIPPAGTRAGIEIGTALVPAPATTSEGALYLTLRNTGPEDTLIGVWSDASARAEVHQTMPGGSGMSRMAPVSAIILGAGETLRLVPDSMHVMLLDFRKKPSPGESVPIRLRFRRAGDIQFSAPVVPYTEVTRLLQNAPTR